MDTMMEAIENNWDDILHESLQFPSDTFIRDSLQSSDYLEFGTCLWGSQSRRNDPLAVLGSIGTIPPFNSYSSNSTNSSPLLSDDYIYQPDRLKKTSASSLSSEGTISPRDSVFLSPDPTESTMLPPSRSEPYQSSPGPRRPIPLAIARPTDPGAQATVKRQREEVPPAGLPRRRSVKLAASVAGTGGKSVAGVSNNNNSKPMTARDRKRRQMHNASAMRSRIRLNETLDKMWRTIPLARRRKGVPSVGGDGEANAAAEQMEEAEEDDERIGRADKVEVGIEYIAYLEDRVKELEERLNESR